VLGFFKAGSFVCGSGRGWWWTPPRLTRVHTKAAGRFILSEPRGLWVLSKGWPLPCSWPGWSPSSCGSSSGFSGS